MARLPRDLGDGLSAGLSWRPAAVAALHHLRGAGETIAAESGQPFGGVSLWLLRRDHPLYAVLRVRYDEAETWYAVYTRVADVAFLQLLFGLRSADDLVAWYPDCVVRTAETRALLNALFPRQPSFVWPVV